MSDGNFTAGPWHVGDNPDTIENYRGHVLFAMQRLPEISTAQHIHNKNLVAAAVDLHRALNGLAEAVEAALDAGLFLSVDGKRPDVQALRIAHEALAKARGEAP